MIHFWELPKKRISVLLKPEYKTDFMKSFLRQTKSIKNAGRSIGYSVNTIKRLRNVDKKIKIDIVIKISEFLKKERFSLEEIEKNIIWVGNPLGKAISNPKLPFDFVSKQGARFVSAIFNDGCIARDLGKGYGVLMYDNFNKGLRDSVKKDAVSVMGGDLKIIREVDTTKKKYLVFPSVYRDIMLKIIKPGPKPETNSNIPKFVFENKNTMLGWIEQTIADEGEVKYYKKRYRRAIVWRRSVDITDIFPENLGEVSIRKLPIRLQKIAESKKCKLIEDEIKILKMIGISYDIYNIGVYSTKKGKIRTRWQINITKRENLMRLRKMIKIPHIEKDEKFSLVMKEFTRYLEPINIRKAAERIQKRNGFITSRDLKKEMSYTQIGTASQWVSRLEKEGFLKHIKKSVYSENHREPAQYIILNKLQAS